VQQKIAKTPEMAATTTRAKALCFYFLHASMISAATTRATKMFTRRRATGEGQTGG